MTGHLALLNNPGGPRIRMRLTVWLAQAFYLKRFFVFFCGSQVYFTRLVTRSDDSSFPRQKMPVND